jgi:hypothetical protein
MVDPLGDRAGDDRAATVIKCAMTFCAENCARGTRGTLRS